MKDYNQFFISNLTLFDLAYKVLNFAEFLPEYCMIFKKFA